MFRKPPGEVMPIVHNSDTRPHAENLANRLETKLEIADDIKNFVII
jgi:hypothetical protein